MDIDANDLFLFARIMECGSFSRASERTGLPKSTISRRISALESRLGERLLLRTTRALTLTEFGRGLLDHAEQVARQVDSASAFAQHRQAEPSGRLRISMPSDFATIVLGDLLARFTANFPAIVLELDLSPRRVDLIGENFDLAIRIGDLPDDASLAAKRMVSLTIGLYASPGYTVIRGLPDSPQDLLQHDALCLPGPGGTAVAWVLTRGEASWEGLPRTRVTANSPELLCLLARKGAGITAISDGFAAPFVRQGELVRLLPEWSQAKVDVWAVFPAGRRLMPAKTRVFLDALESAFASDFPTSRG